jgi:acyl-CoA synthetase (AMP-forming)/AMP-acid ligase II
VPEKGARVATWLAKTELACLMPLAAVRAGLVHVPVNPLLKRAQVAHILADSGARLMISNTARLDTLEPGDAGQAALCEEAGVRAGLAGEADPLPPSQSMSDDLAAISTPADRPAGPRAWCSAMRTCGWGRSAWRIT